MWWFFHLFCATSWTTQNSDQPGDYWSNSRTKFEDRNISLKSLGEEVSISLDRVEFIIHEYLYMRNLREMSTEMLESGGKTGTVPVVWANLEIFRRYQNDFLSGAIGDHVRNLVVSLWTGNKTTLNGVAAWSLSSNQNVPSEKIRWKISRVDFWDHDGILLIDSLPKGQTINAEYY